MSDIFREVDEALQQEKAAKLWKEYGPTILAAIGVLIISTGLTTAYRAWSSHANKTETTALVMAAEDKDIAAAMETAAIKTDGGHKAIGLMNAASKAASSNDFVKTAGLYESVASDKSAPKDLRDLATILGTRASLLVKTDKEPDFKALVSKLDPIANSTRSPFARLAKLETALLYGNGLKDYNAALNALKGLDQETLSDSIKEKASALKRVYDYELSQISPTAKSE
jgi:hypothetical protein